MKVDSLTNKILKDLGVGIKKLIGQGAKGRAYLTKDDRILKMTQDDAEASNSHIIKGENMNYVANIYEVKKVVPAGNIPKNRKVRNFIDDNPFVILMEKIKYPPPTGLEGIWGDIEFVIDRHGVSDIDLAFEPRDKLKSIANVLKNEYKDIYLKVFWNIYRIQRELREYGIAHGDLHTDNLGIKNGKLAAFDLGQVAPHKEIGDRIHI